MKQRHDIYEGPVKAQMAFVQVADDGESSTSLALFSRKAVEKALGPIANDLDGDVADEVSYKLTGWHEFCRGVGRAFGTYPSIRVCRDWILVKQYRGLDI